MGDATNFVVCFAGQLLQHAEYLLKMGLHISEVMEGYRVASAKALELFEGVQIDSFVLFKKALLTYLKVPQLTRLMIALMSMNSSRSSNQQWLPNRCVFLSCFFLLI